MWDVCLSQVSVCDFQSMYVFLSSFAQDIVRCAIRSEFLIRPKIKFSHGILERGVKKALGDLDGARRDCDGTIELDPELAHPYVNRSLLRRASGDICGAVFKRLFFEIIVLNDVLKIL